MAGYGFCDDEFWNIVSLGDDIYFQSFRSLFRYDGERVTTLLDNEHRPLNIFNCRDKLYSQLIYKDLSTVTADGYKSFISRTQHGNCDIVAMLESGNGSSTILCTDKAGLYILDDNHKVKPFATEIDRILTEAWVNRAIRMKDGTIAIGTIRNGVYALTPEGRMLWHYNIENGLGNNSVLGLSEDRYGNLWVMLDHGISVIHSGLPYSFLRPNAGEPFIGMAYDMLRSGDRLYVGTNQGLYIYSFTDDRVTVDDKMHSQIWHIDNIDNQILVGGGTLSARYTQGGITEINTNSSTDITKGTIHTHEVLIESSYYDLRAYFKDKNGAWKFSHNIKGFGGPVRQIEIDNDGSVWCAHLAKGVIRLELSPDLRRVENIIHFSRSTPDKPKATSFVMKIRGQIVLSDGDSLYTYDHTKRRLNAMETFHNDLPAVKEVYKCTPVDDRLFWLSSRKSYTLVSFANGHYRREMSIPLDYLSIQSNGVNNCVYVDQDRNCYFAINNGVGRVFLPDVTGRRATGEIGISRIEHTDPDGTVSRLPLRTDKDNQTEVNGNIHFYINYPSYNFSSPKFVYRLNGPDKMERVSDKPEIDFAGLRHGDYVFTASLTDDSGNVLASSDYEFTVPVPGHLTYWAMSGYALALAALIAGISKLYGRRQVRLQQQRHEIETATQNVKILEQERIINEQQKRLLEHELSVKSKELASMALEANYKHQVIENLRETINAQRLKGNIGQPTVNSLINTINSDIGSKEFWEIFHNNFDLIHENFFRNLRQRYPELTANDLKFCALLRLNMSTKDIAKFTQMTVRGVEGARYRLRHKFGLAGNESIVQFLIDFK